MTVSRLLHVGWWITVSCWAHLALSQEPPIGEMPRHGYIKALEMQRFRAAVGLPPSVSAAPDEPQVQIEHAVPLVLVNFSDLDPPYPIDTLQDCLFGTDEYRWRQTGLLRPSFRQYFADMSYGRWRVNGRCYGWYNVGKKDDFHNANSASDADLYLGIYKMIWEALEKADHDIDFSRFDTENSGPLVDENPDGFVDTVFIIHPLIARERTSIVTRSKFPSHNASLSRIGQWLKAKGKTLPGEPPYKCNDLRRDSYGNRMTDEGECVVIDDYCLVPAAHEPPVLNSDPVIPVGTYCHEYGHMLGLPDLYDRTDQHGPNDGGLGNWCLMAEGLCGHGGLSPGIPVPLSPWCRDFLGWSEPQLVTSLLSQVIDALGMSSKVTKIELPRRDPRWERYILVEHRSKREKLDLWKVNWDQSMPAPFGVALWLVDESVGREEAPGAPNTNWPFAVTGKGQCDDKDLPLVKFTSLLTSGGESEIDGGVKVACVEADDTQATISIEANAAAVTDLPEAPQIAIAEVEEDVPIHSAPSEEGEIEEIAEKVVWFKQFGAADLNHSEEQVLRNISDHVLQSTLPRGVAGIVRAEARKARTVDLADITDPTGTEIDKEDDLPAIVAATADQWKQWGGKSESTLVRTAPEGKTIEWFCGIEKPIHGIEFKKAQLTPSDLPSGASFEEVFLKFTEDPNIRLEADSYQPAKAQDERDLNYHQVVEYQNAQYPLLGLQTTLKIGDDGSLRSGKFETIEPQRLTISGSFEGIDEAGVEAKVAEALEIDVGRVKSCNQGVGLVDKDPQKARLGYELCVSAGEGRSPIKVFVDGETGRILYVRSE
jgi:M6 family metalloprotease-like protein